MGKGIPDGDLPNDSQQIAVLLAGGDHDVLELGCGPGHVTRLLAGSGSTVVGVEIDPAAAAEARRWAAEVHVADLDRTPLGDVVGARRFQRIVLGDVLEHLPRPQEVLTSLREHLDEDGFLVSTIPNVTHADVRLMLLGGRWRYQDNGLLDRTHLRFFDREGVLELFDSCGWRIERFEATTKGVGESELAALAPPLAGARELATSLGDPGTYQFVVAARPDPGTPDNVVRFARPAPAASGGSTTAAPGDSDRLQAENDQLRVRLRMLEEELEDAHWSAAARRRRRERARTWAGAMARRARSALGRFRSG